MHSIAFSISLKRNFVFWPSSCSDCITCWVTMKQCFTIKQIILLAIYLMIRQYLRIWKCLTSKLLKQCFPYFSVGARKLLCILLGHQYYVVSVISVLHSLETYFNQSVKDLFVSTFLLFPGWSPLRNGSKWDFAPSQKITIVSVEWWLMATKLWYLTSRKEISAITACSKDCKILALNVDYETKTEAQQDCEKERQHLVWLWWFE